MTLDEHTRHELYQLVEEHLGERGAVLLMEYLPPVGWGEVATKRDLDSHAVLMKHDLDAHAASMTHDLDSHAVLMKHDLDSHAASMKHDLDSHAASMRHDLDALEQRWALRFDASAAASTGEISGLREWTGRELAGVEERLALRIASSTHEATTRLVLWLFPTLLTAFGLVFAVAKLA